MLHYFPKYFSTRATNCYLLVILAVVAIFPSNTMPLYMYLIGTGSVVLFFFYGSNNLSKRWLLLHPKLFERKIFRTAFWLRLAWAIFIYFFNIERYGTPNGSSVLDAGWYLELAEDGLNLVKEGNWNVFSTWISWGIDIPDAGYAYWLFLVYLLSGHFSPFILPLVLKCLLSAQCCVWIYRIGKMHFGESTGRLAAIFCVLDAMLIWYSGSMLKETEMIFLSVAFIYSSELALRKAPKVKNFLLPFLFITAMFTFRAALAAVAFISLFLTAVFTSSKVTTPFKKGALIAGLLVILAFSINNMILGNITEGTETGEILTEQSANMAWRAEREGGNSFAKYAGATVFAPLIFTIPFPSMTYTTEDQEMLMELNGGYFIKNVMSFFVILALFTLLFSGQWRAHVLPIAFTCGYLMALVLSVYAQSGRFHMPIIPFELMFAAFGVSQMDVRKAKWFNWVLVAEFFICIAWQWFKLKGKGLL